MKCPLCECSAKFIESISTDKIVSLWSKKGIDVSELLVKKEIIRYKCHHCGLGFFSPACPGDDVFYGKLSQWDWYYKHTGKTEYDVTSNLVTSGSSLLDVGCGIGEITRFLPSGVDFTGIELSSKSIEIAQSLGRNVIRHDITDENEWCKNKFDVVTCFQVIEHIVDIDLFFSSLVGACKPGGILVLAVPNNDGFVGDAVNNIFNMPPHHTLLWNRSSLEYLANKYNLLVDKYIDESISDVHRLWACSVKIRKSMSFGDGLKSVDISFFGKVKMYLSYIIALPLSHIYQNFVNSGHTSIIVLRRG